MDRYSIRKRIQTIRAEIEQREGWIHEIASAYIPDYHFMDHYVSTFWECEKSPIGMCVFDRNNMGTVMSGMGCRYCGNALERK